MTSNDLVQDQAALMTGQTALVATIAQLLISKDIITLDEARTAVEDLLIKARMTGAERGVEVAPLHFLAAMNHFGKS